MVGQTLNNRFILRFNSFFRRWMWNFDVTQQLLIIKRNKNQETIIKKYNISIQFDLIAVTV